MSNLPVLRQVWLTGTRYYLQDVAKVLGKLQQAYLAAEPRGWQYGLEVTMRGISTQTFELDGQPVRGLLDLVRHKVRFGERNWSLRETPPAQLFNDIEAMLGLKLNEPEFTSGIMDYDQAQADAYAEALWWMAAQFRDLKTTLLGGKVSPILLYPHHFDLSLGWFPHDNEHQLTIGFSTGDDAVAEPYVYVTAYPEIKAIKSINLPPAAHWQSKGFSGAVLPYASLREYPAPEKLFQAFARQTMIKTAV